MKLKYAWLSIFLGTAAFAWVPECSEEELVAFREKEKIEDAKCEKIKNLFSSLWQESPNTNYLQKLPLELRALVLKDVLWNRWLTHNKMR